MMSGALMVSSCATPVSVEIVPPVTRVSDGPPVVPMVNAPALAVENKMLCVMLGDASVTEVFTLLAKVAVLVETGTPPLQLPESFHEPELAPLQVSVAAQT